jgi:hypothetical protein
MRRLTPILALAAALAVAAPASAKEVLSVRACGPEHCVTSEDEAVLRTLMNGGTPSEAPGRAAPVVVMRASIGDSRTGEEFGTFMSAWVPRRSMLVDESGTWMRVPPEAEAAFDRMARGLGTFPPSQLGRLAQSEIDLPAASPEPPPRRAPAPSPGSGTSGTWLLLLPAGVVLALGVARSWVFRRRFSVRT